MSKKKTDKAQGGKAKDADPQVAQAAGKELEPIQSAVPQQAEQAEQAEQAKQAKQTESRQETELEGSQEAAPEQGESDSAQQIAKLQAEKQELKEALLRKQADFENYRRRMQKDKEEAIQYANRGLITELLEVLDNFERALLSHQHEKDSSPEMKGLFEGLELVEKQLTEMLSSRWGLKAIDSVGQEFDPNFHEALMMEESPDYQAATVVENFQTGYILHDRVLRPARVKVAKPAG